MRLRTGLVLACAAVTITASSARGARGQGFLVDRRPESRVDRAFEIREVTLNARVRDQVAEVQISQTFHNPGSFVVESEYLFPLPEEGAVENFVLMVDGQELPGRLLPKDEARRIFEDIVRLKRDPALLEYMGRGLYRTSVFPIPPGADRKVTMRYAQLCKRDRDVVEFVYPFATQKFTAKPIRALSLSVRIESRDAIKSVYCPNHDASVRRDGDHEARVALEQRDVVPATDFRLIYTLHDGALGASVLSDRPSESDDGYFLLLASPRVKAEEVAREPKTVIFVLDRSGSMAGKKIAQARNALKFVLGNLRDDDTYNIVAYDDRVETFEPELQRCSERSRAKAERFVENIREGGSTNLDDALKSALGMIHDDSRPAYVLFLTDGLPTAGETGETAIARNCREANRARARLFVFGVGHDVNARLLDRLSGGNGGTTEYVKPDEDIEAHVARFQSKMTSPALSDIRVELTDVDVNRVYPRDLPDLFDGGQLVVAGRYRQSGRTTVRVSGKVGGARRSWEFPAELASSSRGGAHDFVAKLWATRRVGDLIDQIDLHGQNKELIDELVALSTRYGILTPYTSFLADDRVRLHARAENHAAARKKLRDLEVVDGLSGVTQRAYKQDLMNAASVARLDAARPASAPMGAGMGGMGGGGMGGFGTVANGGSVRSAKPVSTTVRNVGAKTFFRKGDRWIDAEVKPEDEAKAVLIRLFSDEFFDLARNQSATLNQYLAFEEPVTVNLDGRTYRFEQAAR